MGREFELKFRANKDVIDKIQKKFPGFSTIQMETAYYDTPGRDLSLRRWTLRRRMENGASVCTLKTPLGDGSRGEWEVLCDTIEAGVLELCKLQIPDGLAALAKRLDCIHEIHLLPYHPLGIDKAKRMGIEPAFADEEFLDKKELAPWKEYVETESGKKVVIF